LFDTSFFTTGQAGEQTGKRVYYCAGPFCQQRSNAVVLVSLPDRRLHLVTLQIHALGTKNKPFANPTPQRLIRPSFSKQIK
jgi:hypothetical protein